MIIAKTARDETLLRGVVAKESYRRFLGVLPSTDISFIRTSETVDVPVIHSVHR